MYDQYNFWDDEIENVKNKEGEVLGFQFRTGPGYYRSVPLSMCRKLEVEVDGGPVAPEDVFFKYDGECFNIREFSTITAIYWGFATPAVIFVRKPGGLAPGEHKIRLAQGFAMGFSVDPVVTGEKTKTFTI